MNAARPYLTLTITALFLIACGEPSEATDAGSTSMDAGTTSMDAGRDAAPLEPRDAGERPPDGGDPSDGGDPRDGAARPPDGGHPLGLSCVSGAECGSGFCADGVCCDRACDDACEGCTAVLRGTGSDGECGPVATGSDPDADCDATPASSCGLDGACDGAGACRSWDATTVCAAGTCVSGIASSERSCTGAGSCADGASEPCAPYACGATACLESCAGDGDCVGSARCVAGACTAGIALGGACTAGGAACASGFCVDGVCCNGACTGLCQGCNVAGSLGTCQARPGGWSDDTCWAPLQCSNEGTCLRSGGMTCSVGSECLTRHCVDGYCCNNSCEGTCIACDNVSERGRCAVVRTGLDPDDECLDAATCNGAGACTM